MNVFMRIDISLDLFDEHRVRIKFYILSAINGTILQTIGL